MATAVQDPFSMAFSGLWSVLNASSAFPAVIPKCNQIRYDSEYRRQPDKSQGGIALSADRPQARIIVAGGVEGLLVTSSSTQCTKNYEIQISLGDLRANVWLHPLEFIVTGALANWQVTLSPLVWNGDQFIKMLRVKSIQEGMKKEDLDKGIQSWFGVFGVGIDMWFTSSKIKAIQAGDLIIGDANISQWA